MPSVRYYNQTAPFWDFVASMENNHKEAASNEPEGSNPWDGTWTPFGPFAFRGRHGHGPRGRHDRGPPPPDDHEMTSGEEKDHDHEAGPSEPHGPSPPFSEKPDHPHGHGHGHGHGHHKDGPGGFRGRCAGGRGGRGSWAGRGRGGPGGPMSGLNSLAELFQAQLFGDSPGKASDDFRPDVDVFDTPASFVVHVALPGAKKEDVGVNWDADKSELGIAGVIHRPGDEAFLNTLALDERKVGAFERKVRLGSRANPAQIDAEGITARMEDGVLRVEVPKMEGGFVEIRKVDIL